jgi:hypothetical protein
MGCTSRAFDSVKLPTVYQCLGSYDVTTQNSATIRVSTVPPGKTCGSWAKFYALASVATRSSWSS